MIFSLYTVYKKNDDDENWRGDQYKEKMSSSRNILLPTVHWNKSLQKLNRFFEQMI